MAKPAYSIRIWNGALAAGAEITLNPVPPGNRLILRFVSLTQTSGTNVMVQLHMRPATTELCRFIVPSPASHANFDVRIVYHEGESPHLWCLNSTAYLSLHGYLLTGAGGPLNPFAAVVGGDRPQGSPLPTVP